MVGAREVEDGVLAFEIACSEKFSDESLTTLHEKLDKWKERYQPEQQIMIINNQSWVGCWVEPYAPQNRYVNRDLEKKKEDCEAQRGRLYGHVVCR